MKKDKIRRGVLRQSFIKAVKESGNKGLHISDALAEIEKSTALTDYELALTRAGDVRWKTYLTIGCSALNRFGYLKRSKNKFWITAKGEQALLLSPEELQEEIKNYFKEAKSQENGEGDDESEEAILVDDTAPEVYLESPTYLNTERTVFKRVDYDLGALLHYIDIGDIGLPDIQRPFVWSSSKVRDLFDSMYRGFPVGYLLFLSNAGAEGSRFIGVDEKSRKIPHLLIIDGQQRLTSLYAVFRGKKVVDDDYKEKNIEIAFRPRDGRFEVSDAAIKKDPEFVSNISELWASQKSSWTIINEFLKKIEKKRSLSEKQRETISHNLDRLFDLQKYPFTALEISPNIEEEQAADIFVRINSQGVKLNQGDFILTLLSVFWDEGRKEIELFCQNSRIPTLGSKPSPYNHFIEPDADHLLRVEIAIGFFRGRLKNAYQLLRGKDLETGQVSEKTRNEQFAILKEAQAKTLDLSNWHGFFNCLMAAGYRSHELLTSEVGLLYAYAIYIFGKTKFVLSEKALQGIIGRYFFATSLSNRYVASFESTFESDLGKIKDLKSADDFSKALEKIIADTLTNDFWTIALPNSLDSSSARHSGFFAFLAAQNKLGAPVLFSRNQKISDQLDPTVRANRKALEKHHLFPRAWLEDEGVEDLKQINQIANFALIDWGTNGYISETPPKEYVPIMKKSFNADEWKNMCNLHALPEDWESMSYAEFLEKRRFLMAQIIKKGFEAIK